MRACCHAFVSAGGANVDFGALTCWPSWNNPPPRRTTGMAIGIREMAIGIRERYKPRLTNP
jgi:hypothetical protein